MKRVPVALTGLLMCASVAAAERGPAIPDYPAEKVAESTYVIHGPMGYPSPENRGFMNNPAFVVTDEGVVVIDPGSSVQTGEMVLRQVAGVTDKPVVAVLNTHVHGDHWLGNHAIREAYPEVPVYGHPKMIAQVKKGAGEEWVGRMMRATEGATAGTMVIGPNLEVKHGDELSIGGMTFRFHHVGTAHSQTDVMIEVPERELLFMADNANNQRIVRMDDGTFTGNAETLNYALEIPAKVYVPGHGKTGSIEFVRDYRDYLAELYAAVEELYDEGLQPFEMKERVAERLAKYQGWTGFEDELGKHISLAYLEVEANMFE